MLSMLPVECWKTIYVLGQMLLQGFCFSPSPVGHCPGGGPAMLQQNEQLKDEVHPSYVLVPATVEETFPGRALLQKVAFGGRKMCGCEFACMGFADLFVLSFNSTDAVNRKLNNTGIWASDQT